jgi:large subunit ribosomal protein L24
MKLELDRMTVAGRVAYAWTVEDRPARLDAALTATEIDLDRVQLLAKGMLGGAAFDWPREGALSLKIGRGLIAGVEAKQADVNVRFGATGLAIEQLAVADFGGAALAVKGRIGTNAQAPRGALTLDLDARALDGVTAVLEKFAPQTADRLRRSAGRLTPLVLRASLAVDPIATGAAAANGKFKIVGRAGTFRVALEGDAGAAGDAFKLDNLAALAGAKVNVSGRLDGDDGAALVELMGLDRFVVADKRPGRLTLTAKGPLDGELAIDGQLAAGSLNIASNGTLRLAGRASPSAALNLKVANANLRLPRPAAAGRAPEVLPTTANARLTWTDGILGFSGLTGTMAGTTIGGRLAVGLQQQPITIDGDLDAGALDLPAAIAVALGLPAQSVGTAAAASGGALGPWPSEPFEALPRLSGQVAIKSARVKLTPKLAARDVRAVVRFGESELALQAVEGSIAGGKLGAELTLSHRPEGLAARASVQLAGVNAAELLPGDGVVTGKLTLDAKVEGSGLSAVALIGSLAGDGTFKLENGRVVRLDPAAFETVMRAVDQGLQIDSTRIRDRMDAALASGVLSVALAEGAISVNAGQARLNDVTVRAQRADIAVSGSVNLADAALEGRLTLSGMGGTNAPANTRPEITIGLKGSVDTPKRSMDVAALSSWLALRAVEQQSRKLEALEGRAPATPATAATANANPRTAPAQPALATDAAVPAAVHIEPDAADPQPVARPQPAPPKAQKPKPAVPTAERAPTLPPPIDVRPPPTPPAPRAAAAGAHGAATQPQKPVAAPAPPRQRTWSEILFGN